MPPGVEIEIAAVPEYFAQGRYSHRTQLCELSGPRQMICLVGASSQMADPKREGPIEKELTEERLLLTCVCSPHPSRTIALARQLLSAPAAQAFADQPQAALDAMSAC